MRGEGPTSDQQKKQPWHVKVATASLIGTAIEWYDFFLYGTAAALIFNKLFFLPLILWWVHCLRSQPTRWGSWRGHWVVWYSGITAISEDEVGPATNSTFVLRRLGRLAGLLRHRSDLASNSRQVT
jgi:hypothetical protein